MNGRFENFWKSAAGDGALSPVGVGRPEVEVDALMDAWYRERQDNIESRLYLEEARRLLRKFMEVDTAPQQLRKQTKHLLRAVRELERETPDDE